MSVSESIRSSLPVLTGLVIGIAGAVLFQQSMPGANGSAEERVAKLEAELKRAQNRIAALEAPDGGRSRRGDNARRARWFERTPRATLADTTRTLVEDIRDGKPVSPDDIFRATKPLLRDLAPLFDRIRLKEQRQRIDSLTGELARKYDLTPENQAALKEWFQQKTVEEANRWSELLAQDHTGLEEMMRASRDIRPDQGLDTFMEGILTGDKLTRFKSERLAERAERVQQEADMKVQRLDGIVGLDESQRDQVFGIIARSSRDYDPAMRLEGAGGEIGATPVGNRQAAILAVLRPEQRAAYEAERDRRRDEAATDLAAIGLTLPPNWEMLDGSDFR
jgi:hypothetical protein